MPDDTPNDAAETSAADTPATDTPGTDAPATDTPGTDAPATDTPGSDTPGSDTPGTDAPATDTPTTPAADTRRRPSPAAAAASRARRIGGTPAAGRSGASTARTPADGGTDRTAPEATGSEAEDREPGTVSTTKTPRGARTPKAAKTSKTTRAAELEDDEDGDTAPERTRTRREAPAALRWIPAAVLVAGALVMLIVLATASHGVWWGQPSANEARDKVLAAAKTCTVNTNSYSYLTFDADKKKGVACTTGAQSQRYTNAMETLIRAKAKTLKATQMAQINTAGVQAITNGGRQWTILVFGQIKIITTQTGKSGRIDPFAARVRMDNVNGTWLLSAIDTVTSAGA